MPVVEPLSSGLGRLRRTPESPHQCTLYWWLPLSPTYRTVLQADKTYNEAGLLASPFQVCAYLSEAALLPDGLGQGSRMTIICAFEITGAQRLYSVQDKVSWGRSPSPRDQARETSVRASPPPPKEKQNIAWRHLPLSNVSGLGSFINLYGWWKYSNKSEIFA